ncbi:DUF881 domain-containing protein [Microlunatus ginsengisoli]|uniref:DUF881 domain-containing protein n=1 Tax=Microlunatus ginsengisoli TaxID=363863 RepID=A0ABP7ACK2_9ACTN
MRDRLRRVGRVLQRARAAQRWRDRRRSRVGRLVTAVVCVLAGLMIATSALNARGTDLRPGRNTDLVSLIQSQSRRNAQLSSQLTEIRRQVDALSAANNAQEPDLGPELRRQSVIAGVEAVAGPSVTVTLTDAPSSVAANGIDPDLLVVHQQDIQAVVNALWSGGAEAMTIQGQRVIATTGVKCVGNTVVLHGVPYAPPYVISAIGDPVRLRAALTSSEAIKIYQQYVAAYDLGYQVRQDARSTFPAYDGSLDLDWAHVNREVSPSASPTR